MKAKSLLTAVTLLGALATVSCNKQQGPVREAVSHKDDYQQAYVYGFPMIAAYKAMYEFNVDAGQGLHRDTGTRRCDDHGGRVFQCL